MKRLQVDISDTTDSYIEKVRAREETTRAEVIRKSIKMYERISELIGDDGSLTYINKDGEAVKLIIL